MNRFWKVTPLLTVVVGLACNTKGNDNVNGEFLPMSAPSTQPGPQPTFKTAAALTTSPPAISGGTLTIGKDGRTAVAADPDRDRIYVVDLPSRTVKFSIKVADGAEPGRVAIDDAGRAHVALRNTGNIASIDLATGAISERHVCLAPRGLAYDAKAKMLHVACAEGFFVSAPLDGGELRRVALDKDLRDVVLTKSAILVSRFRAADYLVLSRDGVYQKRNPAGGNLGWRMIAAETPPPAPADDEDDTTQVDIDKDLPAMVSQEPTDPTVSSGGSEAGSYGGGGAKDACSASTVAATRLDLPGQAQILIPPAVLPVDLATNGREYAIVAAGNGHTSDLPQVFVHSARFSSDSKSSFSGSGTGCRDMATGFVPGQAVAAAFDGDDQLIVQSREPAALYIMTPDRQRVLKEITLSDEGREDTGHAIFHSNSGGFIACASCHAEGGDDGRTWSLVEGIRRTPSMRGTIANTAPFHWDGAMKDLRTLVDHVFISRMNGPKIDNTHVDRLKTWLEKLPAPAKIEQSHDAVERGKVLFEQRCTTCHSGPEFTNNQTHDVGTGGPFQVPSLVGVVWRAPFLHNGCAKTIKDRFVTECGGDKHGDVTGLDGLQIEDLTTYVESL